MQKNQNCPQISALLKNPQFLLYCNETLLKCLAHKQVMSDEYLLDWAENKDFHIQLNFGTVRIFFALVSKNVHQPIDKYIPNNSCYLPDVPQTSQETISLSDRQCIKIEQSAPINKSNVYSSQSSYSIVCLNEYSITITNFDGFYSLPD